MRKKRNKTRRINNKKRRASMQKNNGNKSPRKSPRKSPKKSPRKIKYSIGDHIIMKPKQVRMGGRSEGTIQYKNVRIDEIEGDKYKGTIFFPNGKQMSNYNFYLCEIQNKIS